MVIMLKNGKMEKWTLSRASAKLIPSFDSDLQNTKIQNPKKTTKGSKHSTSSPETTDPAHLNDFVNRYSCIIVPFKVSEVENHLIGFSCAVLLLS